MKNYREEIRRTGLTEERFSILCGISGARLSKICRQLVEPTEVETEKIERILREAGADNIYSRILRLTGVTVSVTSGLSRKDIIVISFLANILEEIRALEGRTVDEGIAMRREEASANGETTQG